MRSSRFFWGGVLVLLGALFLFDNLGIIEINQWNFIWPLLLIFFGLWVLIGYFLRGESRQGENASIPLGAVRSAAIRLHHGAGQLKLSSGAEPTDLVSGIFGGGLQYKTKQEGDQLSLTMRIRDIGYPVFIPWLTTWQSMMNWDVKLNQEIPLKLVVKTGASDTNLDLTQLQVTELRIETGASATTIRLPENVPHIKVVVKAGVASVNMEVPKEVAARIHITGGLMGAIVDRNRFPKSAGYYQSPDFDTASNKAEIHVHEGVGSVSIH